MINFWVGEFGGKRSEKLNCLLKLVLWWDRFRLNDLAVSQLVTKL